MLEYFSLPIILVLVVLVFVPPARRLLNGLVDMLLEWLRRQGEAKQRDATARNRAQDRNAERIASPTPKGAEEERPENVLSVLMAAGGLLVSIVVLPPLAWMVAPTMGPIMISVLYKILGAFFVAVGLTSWVFGTRRESAWKALRHAIGLSGGVMMIVIGIYSGDIYEGKALNPFSDSSPAEKLEGHD